MEKIIVKNLEDVVVFAGGTFNPDRNLWFNGTDYITAVADNVPSDFKPGHYKLISGTWAKTAKGLAAVSENIEKIKVQKRYQLKIDVNAYIDSHYSPKQRESLRAFESGFTAEQQVKTQEITAWAKAVTQYYVDTDKAIQTDENTTWDFSQFDATKPDHDLRSIMG